MWKKVILPIIITSIILIGILIFNFVKSKNKDSEEKVKNEINISKFVTDECIDEWEDYSITIQDEINQASTTLTDENKTYILREINGYINLYYINEKNEEILYKVTEISTQFLGEEDISKLKRGIEVRGLQGANQLLEDFE